MPRVYKRTPFEERFWNMVMPEPNTGCWIWTGAYTRRGYGMISLGGRKSKTLTASHASLKVHGIEVPLGMQVNHKCDNKWCVNPEHLWVGTQSDNMRDMWRKGRGVGGKGNLGRKRAEHEIRRGGQHHNWGKRKSVCKHGHELVEENTFLGKDGHRRCLACRNARALAAYYAKRSKTGAITIRKGEL
jgi:hypothetical protein